MIAISIAQLPGIEDSDCLCWVQRFSFCCRFLWGFFCVVRSHCACPHWAA